MYRERYIIIIMISMISTIKIWIDISVFTSIRTSIVSGRAVAGPAPRTRGAVG